MGVMKDQRESESPGKVLHSGDEGPKGAGKHGKSPS